MRPKGRIGDTSLNKCKQGTLFFLVFLYKILYNFLYCKKCSFGKSYKFIALLRERATMEVFKGKVENESGKVVTIKGY